MSNDALFCVYLVVGSLLFSLGATGLAARRNVLVMTLCAAVALQGAALVAIACGLGRPQFPTSLVVPAAVVVMAVQLMVGTLWAAVSHRRNANLDPASWNRLADDDRGNPPS